MLRRKPMVPRGSPIITIGYKYSAWKVLFLIVTENAGITKAGLNCLSQYPDQFSNVANIPAAFTQSMYKFLGVLMRLTSTTNKGSLICN